LWLLPKYEVKGQVVGLSFTIQVNAPHKGQRIIGIISKVVKPSNIGSSNMLYGSQYN
jgi:hypothetical protein